MKITKWTIQTPRTNPKFVTYNIAQWKQTLSKKKVFLKIQLHIHFLSKCQKCSISWVQCYFFNPTIWKPTTPAFQNTLTFASYLFNSTSNMHENLVHWNSLHSKKAILPTFLGQTPQFLCENYKNRTYNLHHQKAWSVAVILSLRVGVQHKETKLKFVSV